MGTTSIGIAGPSGAGKTALARELARALGQARTVVLPLDAYYRDLAALEAARRAAHNFDHPDAVDRPLLVAHVRALVAGEAVEVPLYRFDTHTRAPGGRRVGPGRFVVVEGLFALCWPELRELLQLKLFVEVGDELALSRRLERDVSERGRTAESVRAQYRRTVRPMYRRWVLPARRFADLVLDGSRPLDELTEQVLPRLR